MPKHPTFPAPQQAPSKPAADWKAIVQSNQDLQTQSQVYLDAVTPEGDAVAVSVETTLLAKELRFDRQYGVGGWPFATSVSWFVAFFFPKCFAFFAHEGFSNGGSVRGISSLYVLKAIMGKGR